MIRNHALFALFSIALGFVGCWIRLVEFPEESSIGDLLSYVGMALLPGIGVGSSTAMLLIAFNNRQKTTVSVFFKNGTVSEELFLLIAWSLLMIALITLNQVLSPENFNVIIEFSDPPSIQPDPTPSGPIA